MLYLVGWRHVHVDSESTQSRSTWLVRDKFWTLRVKSFQSTESSCFASAIRSAFECYFWIWLGSKSFLNLYSLGFRWKFIGLKRFWSGQWCLVVLCEREFWDFDNGLIWIWKVWIVVAVGTMKGIDIWIRNHRGGSVALCCLDDSTLRGWAVENGSLKKQNKGTKGVGSKSSCNGGLEKETLGRCDQRVTMPLVEIPFTSNFIHNCLVRQFSCFYFIGLFSSISIISSTESFFAQRLLYLIPLYIAGRSAHYCSSAMDCIGCHRVSRISPVQITDVWRTSVWIERLLGFLMR